MEGWAKFNRELLESWIFADADAWKVYSYIKLDCTHTYTQRKSKGQVITLYPGQTIFGRFEWEKRLNIDASKVYRIIHQLEQGGYISIFSVKGQRTIITITDNEQETTQKPEQEIEQGKWPNNAALNGNNEQVNEQHMDSKKTHNKNGKNEKNIHNEFFESLWKLYPEKKGKAQVSDKQKAILFKVGFDEMSRCIKRYITDKPQWQNYKNGSTFFNKGYVDYLDSEYEKSDRTATTEEKQPGTPKDLIVAPANFGGENYE